MPGITITVDSSNNITVNPPVLVTNPHVGLHVVWTLVNNGTLVPQSPFINFPWPVPNGINPVNCSSWSRFPNSVSTGPGPNQNQATMPALPTNAKQCYKYSVVFTTTTFDPEVENQGPPPMDEEHGRGDEHRPDKKPQTTK